MAVIGFNVTIVRVTCSALNAALKTTATTLATVVALSLALMLPAYADNWPILPDGRIVIEVFGERLAFERTDDVVFYQYPKGGRPVDRYFYESRGERPPRNAVHVSLQQMLSAPAKYRKVLERIDDSSPLSIMLGDGRSRRSSQGRAAAKSSRRTAFGGISEELLPCARYFEVAYLKGCAFSVIKVFPSLEAKHEDWDFKRSVRTPKQLTKQFVKIREFGLSHSVYIFRNDGLIKNKNTKHRSAIIIFNGDNPGNRLNYDVLLGCDKTFGRDGRYKICSIGNHGVDWKVLWSGAFSMAPNFPNLEWLNYVKLLHRIIDNIFIERTSNEIR